ncbi:MAG: hypothetical protein EKK55_18310 [Rhodocyclaceae bacterium]|nr:MAG: hypothetical protein EKK55_18310 [Rhodocyclaceae bacterium]
MPQGSKTTAERLVRLRHKTDRRKQKMMGGGVVFFDDHGFAMVPLTEALKAVKTRPDRYELADGEVDHISLEAGCVELARAIEIVQREWPRVRGLYLAACRTDQPRASAVLKQFDLGFIRHQEQAPPLPSQTAPAHAVAVQAAPVAPAAPPAPPPAPVVDDLDEEPEQPEPQFEDDLAHAIRHMHHRAVGDLARKLGAEPEVYKGPGAAERSMNFVFGCIEKDRAAVAAIIAEMQQ